MKFIAFSLLASIYVITTFAQKPIIGSSVFNKWPSVDHIKVSNDGHYMTYLVNNVPEGGYTTVVKGIYDVWERTFENVVESDFTDDSKKIVFREENNILHILSLGTGEDLQIDHISSYRILGKGEVEWLAYQANPANQEGKLVIRNLHTSKEESILSVRDYWFNGIDVLAIQIDRNNENTQEKALYWWNLTTGTKKTILMGWRAESCSFDKAGQQIAFITVGPGQVKRMVERMLWYYKDGMKEAESRTKERESGIDTNLMIYNSQPFFSKDGNRLFFKLVEKPLPKAPTEAVKVDVWSYRDIRLQDEQIRNLMFPKVFLATMDIGSGSIVRLQQDSEQISAGMDEQDYNNYLLVGKGGGPEFWWQETARPSMWLVSMKDMNRKLIKERIAYAYDWDMSLEFYLSPKEQFVIYYDPFEKGYFCYEIKSGLTKNITSDISVSWRNENDEKWASPWFGFPFGIAGWVDEDQALLIYDKYDIWKVDPRGIHKPINITNGYGRTNHIRFRLTGRGGDLRKISPHSRLLLTAFDTASKYNGFYYKKLDRGGDPELLTMGPYIFRDPIKAKDADTWIVMRESAKESPNYYATSNFKKFLPMSSVEPEKKYNWLTSELVNWELPDGSTSQGILYKPEDFDPARKYPLLLHYYEERTQDLCRYWEPEATRDDINIPYFVSRGYLIFVPDIHFRTGDVGPSTVNTIVSAARYLSRHLWVDSSRIGLQGHSFGGSETMRIITSTRLFAAAVEGAGGSDAISSYGQLSLGESRQFGTEMGQGRIRASLWERPDLYVSHSSIFDADKVVTPLLMMHNKKDQAVPWAQGVEFFTALRRLGKRVWMLQYDDREHFVDGKDALDYTIRMEQFFDHYLKGMPPPKWMTDGIPATRKGLETGYDLDKSGKMP